MTIKEDLIAYKSNVDLKTRFLMYIADDTININQRWDVYLEAPYEFLDRRHWIVVFDSENHLKGGRIDWYDDYGYTRCQVVDIKDFIEQLSSKEDLANVDMFRAEVLQLGLGSFVYDW